MSQSKLCVHLIANKRDCYVNLPQSLAQRVVSQYDEQRIARPLKVKRGDNTFYFSFAGGVSAQEGHLEIAQQWAQQDLHLDEGEIVQVELLHQVPLSKKLELECLQQSDYQQIAMNRALFETQLLNAICVLYDGEVFPVYYSTIGTPIYVKLRYSRAQQNGAVTIDPHAEIVIKESIQQSQNDQAQQLQDKKLPKKSFWAIKVKSNNEFKENYSLSHQYACVKIDSDLYEQLHLSEKNLYELRPEVPVINNGEGKLKDFQAYVAARNTAAKETQDNTKNLQNGAPQGEERFTFKNPLLVQVRPLGADNQLQKLDEAELNQSSLYFDENLSFAFGIKNRTRLVLDPNPYTIIDITKTRRVSIRNFLHFEDQIRLVFLPVQDLPYNKQQCEREFIEGCFITAVNRQESIVFYSDQLYCFDQNNYFVLKIVDFKSDNKNFLDILAIDCEDSSANPNKSLIQRLQNGANGGSTQSPFALKVESVVAKIFFSSVQEYHFNYPVTRILQINRKINKSELLQSKSTFLNFEAFQILYTEEKQKFEEYLSISKDDKNVLFVYGNCTQSDFFKLFLKSFGKRVEVIDFATFNRSGEGADKAKRFLREKLHTASLKHQAVVFCEGVDRLCKSKERIDFQQSQELLVAEVFSKALKDLIKRYTTIKFVLSAQSRVCVNEELLRLSTKEVTIGVPQYAARKNYFTHFRDNLKYYPPESNQDYLALKSENFTFNEFFLLQKRIGESGTAEIASLESKLEELQNKSYKSQSKNPLFEHVGGLVEAKEIIRETFELPIKFDFLFKKMQLKLPRGILLYGPSGCGKTFLAQAAANELGLNFFSVKGPEMLNKYIGQSEQAVRDIFEKAQAATPSIVFFDEFDAIVPRRNSGSTGVTDRVVNQFLCYLDGVISLEGVYILAATSRPSLIDPALLRPGRIDKHVYLPIPSKEERLEIIKIYCSHRVQLVDLTYEQIAERCEGFTSTDLSSLFKEARIKIAHDLLKNAKVQGKISPEDAAKIKDFQITKQFFDNLFKDFRPSLDKREIDKLAETYKSFALKRVDVRQQKTTLY